MWNLTDGDFDNYAAGAIGTYSTEVIEESAVIVGSAALWGWYSGYRNGKGEGGIPEVIAGSGITWDAVVGVGLHLVNILGYGGQYETWIAGAANGSLAHFAINFAQGLGHRMGVGAWQYEEPKQMGVGAPQYAPDYSDAYARHAA